MAKRSILEQSVSNSFYSTLGTLSSVVLALLFAGFRIRLLGVERAGYMMLLESVTEMSILIGGFGIGTAALKKIAASHGDNDHAAIRRTLGLALSVSLFLGAVVAISAPMFFDFVFSWSKTNDIYRFDAYITTALYGIYFFLRQAYATYDITFSAFQRYDILSALSFAFGLLGGAGGLLILIFLPYMSSLALFTVLLSLAHLVVSVRIVKKLVHGKAVLPKWDLPELRSMLHFSGWAYLTSISTILMNSLDKIVLTTFLGSSSLPYYVIGQRMVIQVHTFFNGQSQFLFPMLAGQGLKTREVIKNVQDRLRWFMAFLSAMTYCGLASFAWLLLSKLIGPQFAQYALLPFLLACLQGFFHAQAIVPFHISWAEGKGAPNAFYQLSIGILVAGTTIYLTPRMDILGASVAQLWHAVTSLMLILWVLISIGKATVYKVIRPYISPFLIIALWFGAIIMMPNGFKIDSMRHILYAMSACVISTGAGIYLEYRIFGDYRCVETLRNACVSLLNKFRYKLGYVSE
jgi:O-antigen/teichoic acid export membrane protein